MHSNTRLRRQRTAPALLGLLFASSPAFAQTSALKEVEAGLAAMGGESKLRTLFVEVESIGHQFALEQSERPEGPFLVTYEQRTETRDPSRRRLLRQQGFRNWTVPRWPSSPPTLVVSDGAAARLIGERWIPGTPHDIETAEDTFDLSPERLLLTAKEATDLKRTTDRSLQGVTHGGVTFTWRGRKASLFLNANTRLPTLLEMTRDDSFGVWGDVVERRWFSFWTLETGGVWVPRRTTTEWNGVPYSDETVLGVKLNPAVDEARFLIPADARRGFSDGTGKVPTPANTHLDESRAVHLSDSVLLLPGPWNVLLVRQPDGLLVIEAPVTPAYSADVVAFARNKFPGVKVKGVVSTSDAWPHIGGLREYVAAGVPVYRLDLNAGLLDRLASAPHSLAPDRLARNPRPATWRTVSKRLTIGDGETRVDLVPVRGETGERMMLAWLPGLGLLYASDLIQRSRSGDFRWVGMLDEVQTAVIREGLGTPDMVVAMHLPPTPWADVMSAIAAIRSR